MCLKIVQFPVSLCVKTGSGLLVDLTWEKVKLSSKVEWCFTVSYQSAVQVGSFVPMCTKSNDGFAMNVVMWAGFYARLPS